MKIPFFLLSLGQLCATVCVALASPNNVAIEGGERLNRKDKPEREGGLLETDRVRLLKSKYGGDAGWKEHEKYRRLDALGLAPILGVFTLQTQLSEEAASWILKAREQAGVTGEQLRALEAELYKEVDRVRRRNQDEIQPVLFRLAATPEAIALAKRATVLSQGWDRRFRGPSRNRPITRDDLKIIEQSAESVRRLLVKLPSATPEQIQADIAALPMEMPSR
ncbi:hypothetical protein ACXR0O_08810 [Verrucomicrobiota bacterium sgz303538]